MHNEHEVTHGPGPTERPGSAEHATAAERPGGTATPGEGGPSGVPGAGLTVEGNLLWSPGPDTVARARITAYQRWLAEHPRYATSAGAAAEPVDYPALWRWSVTDPDGFWASVWDYFSVPGDRPDGPALVADGPMPDVHWFPGARLNYARTALRWADIHPDRAALIGADESGRRRTLTYRQLAAEVTRVAAGLRQLGVECGDRVAAYLPNTIEAAVAFLATASIGAVWSSCSPDFGAASVVDRFAQITPKVLIAVDGYHYNGRAFDRRDTVTAIAAALPDLRATILVGHLTGQDPDALPGDAGPARVVRWSGLRGSAPLTFAEVPFEHPLWVVYSSGTTGLPKPIVHGHGGIVLEHVKALGLHLDLGPGDVFCWFTTTGWMMWNFLLGGLLVGATEVLYDGSPTHPDPDVLWALAAETAITHLGVSAAFLAANAKQRRTPGRTHDLSTLRFLGSTGSPLAPEGFEWVYRNVSDDVLVGSICGGTDVCTAFLGSAPVLPVWAGVLSCRMLGAPVEAYDQAGRPLVDEVGELVLTAPMPSMPVGFWNDPDRSRYRDAYFTVYPGVWRHGDWVRIRPDGGAVVYGRSDSTLNRGGVRMGTADFYRVVEAFDEIADALVVDTGQLGREGQLLLFVTLAPGHRLDDDLVARVRAALRTQLSPRHVPDAIHAVSGVPRTLSGKKLEIPVRRILLGVDVDRAASRDALANPEVLTEYAARASAEHTAPPAGKGTPVEEGTEAGGRAAPVGEE